MANIGYVESILGTLPAPAKQPVSQAFEYVLGNLSFGAVEHQTRATNFQAYWLTGRTSTTANQEVSIAHGLGRVPSYAFQVLALNQVNSQNPVLSVPRAADVNRVYVSSASTNVAFTLMVG